MALSTVVDEPLENPGAEPGRARGWARVGAQARRLVLFLALGAVVLSFGLVAGTGGAADSTRTFSELALTQAQAQARTLAAEARVLAAQGGNAGSAEFQAQAEGLRTQAALLTAPGRQPAAAPTRRSSEEPLRASGETGPDGAGSGDGTPAAGPSTALDRRNLDHYVQTLAASAQTNLQSAWRADAGTARLLAATGAAQQVWATRTANRYGLTLPDDEFPAADGGTTAPDTEDAVEAAGPDVSTCPDGDRPEPTQQAPSAEGTGVPGAAAPEAADALAAAIDAEFGAAYAYEVAFAQDPSAAERGEQWRERAAAHESIGTDAVAYLADLCLPAVAPVAAYRLDAAFLRNPADSLPALEQQFPAVYADLVSLSDGSLRAWAIARLAAVSEELYLQADTVPAAPGLDAVPEKLPWN